MIRSGKIVLLLAVAGASGCVGSAANPVALQSSRGSPPGTNATAPREPLPAPAPAFDPIPPSPADQHRQALRSRQAEWRVEPDGRLRVVLSYPNRETPPYVLMLRLPDRVGRHRVDATRSVDGELSGGRRGLQRKLRAGWVELDPPGAIETDPPTRSGRFDLTCSDGRKLTGRFTALQAEGSSLTRTARR